MGRYELLMPLGSGSMGDVFVARLRGESNFERLFAIKRVKAQWASDERFLKRFFDEARTAAAIHSGFVVPVLDVGRDESGVPFMVQGLVLGLTLRTFLETPATNEVAYALILDALQGLRDAHQTSDSFGDPLRIAHRDISPRNILIGLDGRARLADFGVAKASQREANTAPGELIGSYSYFSPEHLAGSADAQSDVFSMGIVAWEAFRGRRLFEHSTRAELVRALTSATIPSLRDIADVPADVSAVIAQALQRDRSKRWRRAQDFLEALQRCSLRRSAPEPIVEEVTQRTAALRHQLRALADETLVEFSADELTRHVESDNAFVADTETFQLTLEEETASSTPDDS